MNQICWWFVNHISSLLPPDERDALQGDIAELALSGRRALHEVLGLVARRQAAAWQDWRPWLALFGLAVLVGSRLTRISFWIGTMPAMPLFIRWKYGTHYGNGLSAPEEAAVFLCQSLAVISWSWTAGFVLGLLSRRTLWINASLFYFVCFLFWPPRALTIGETSGRSPLIFFYIVLPIILQTVFFVLPSLWGLQRAVRRGTLTMRQSFLLSAATVIITALATWTEGWQQTAHLAWSRGIWPYEVIRWPSRLWPYALVSWPIAYLFAVALSQRWRRKPA
jgi:hypothetical protein